VSQGPRPFAKYRAGSGMPLILRGRFAWAHDFTNNTSLSAAFQSLPGSFIVNGAAIQNSALTSAGAELFVTSRLTVLIIRRRICARVADLCYFALTTLFFELEGAMRRREFVAVLASAVMWPMTGRTQPSGSTSSNFVLFGNEPVGGYHHRGAGTCQHDYVPIAATFSTAVNNQGGGRS
jgi:hypothetical protein